MADGAEALTANEFRMRRCAYVAEKASTAAARPLALQQSEALAAARIHAHR